MSWKSEAAQGNIKKTDLFRVRLSDLKVESGFNLRNTKDKDVREHIDEMIKSAEAGATFPPLEVRMTDDNEIFIVDGHCRREMYITLKNRGYKIEWIDCLPFRGNDADRVFKVIASSQGKPLTPLQRAIGYKRLRAMGIDQLAIASGVGKTTEHVRQLLILADANSDVHAAISAGNISAHTALELIQKHGESAGEHIAKLLGKAKEQGKKKVTKATSTAKLPPRKTIVSFVENLKSQFAKGTTQLESEPDDTIYTVSITKKELVGLLGVCGK